MKRIALLALIAVTLTTGAILLKTTPVFGLACDYDSITQFVADPIDSQGNFLLRWTMRPGCDQAVISEWAPGYHAFDPVQFPTSDSQPVLMRYVPGQSYRLDAIPATDGDWSAGPGDSASLYIKYPESVITVNNQCTGGSYVMSDGGNVNSTSPSTTVYPSYSDQTYTLAFTPPDGYAVNTITPGSSQAVAPGQNASFTVDCVAVGPQPPEVTVTVDPASLSCGQSSLVTWSSNSASSCTNNFNSSTAVSGSATVSPESTTNYTVTCTGGAKTASDTKTVTVTGQCTPPSDPVTVTMSASPTLVNSGQTSTISWSAPAATTCTATSPANWTSKTSNSGSEVVTVTATTTYSMNCSNATDSGNGSAVVNVRPTSYAWINVTTNIANSVWTLNPGNATGYGTGTKTPAISGPTLFTITPDAIANYTYSISNSDGGSSSMTVSPGETKSYTITYTADNNWDYTLSNSGNLSVTKSSSNVNASETIYKTLTTQGGSPSGTFDVTLDQSLTGVSYSIANKNCQPSCNATINFTITPSATTGTFPVTVRAQPGNKTTAFNLIIQNSSAPVVSCTPSASAAKVGDTITWTGGVSGGTAPYSYRWSGSGIPTSPAPSTAIYSMKYTTVGTKAATLQVTDANGQVGSCTPPGTVQVDFNPKFQEF